MRKFMVFSLVVLLVFSSGILWSKDNSQKKSFELNAKVHIVAMTTAKNRPNGAVKEAILQISNMIMDPAFGKMSEEQLAAFEFVKSHGKEVTVKVRCAPVKLSILRTYFSSGKNSWSGDIGTDARIRITIKAQAGVYGIFLVDHKVPLSPAVPAILNPHLCVVQAKKAPKATNASADAAWVKKIKQYYEDNGAEGLTENAQLPAAAKADFDKLNKEWGPDYPPEAMELAIDGKTAYFVEDDNDGGIYVDIFDASGKLIAAGSCGESSDFRWDTIGRKVATVAKAPSADILQTQFSVENKGGNAVKTSDSPWLAKVKKYYEDNGEEGLISIKRAELPAKAQKAWDKYNKTWGPDYPPDPYKYTIDGQTAFFIQDNNDGGMFVDVVDDKGTVLCSGSCSESGEFSW
ncbi:MAG: hypothetical protein HQM09_15675 [Candidatus Riflebacteria bacterium]|nr:hypothetical protein [Candidatus Riflebacteria bacterium]